MDGASVMSKRSHFNVFHGFGSNTILWKLEEVKDDVTNTKEPNGTGLKLFNADCAY